MHAYLSGVGFSNIRSLSMLEHLTEEVTEHYSQKTIFHSTDGRLLAEYSKFYAKNCGLAVVGELDDIGDFHLEYTFPFYQGEQVSLHEHVNIERQCAKDAYSAACDDSRMGITMIFYLSNMGEFRKCIETGDFRKGKKDIILSGIAAGGAILLPLYERKGVEQKRHEAAIRHKKLLNAAKDGDQDAIDSLTMEDADVYNMLSRRVEREDLLSIVETSFIPCGVECDQYNLLGTIRSCEKTLNSITGEKLYQMMVECNDMKFNICINSEDLFGEPAVGRRFRGRIWLQGQVLFNEKV